MNTEPINHECLGRMWQLALAEDGADNDITSQVSLSPDAQATAELNSRKAGIFAGRVLLDLLVDAYAEDLAIEPLIHDGQTLEQGTTLARLSGSLPLLLSVERTLLNFLERLCGVASLTRQFVDAAAGSKAKILDTRKTIPCWRGLDKYAVRCGGGCNHRLGLHDAVLVKDNHLAGISTDRLTEAASAMVARIGRLERQPDFVEFEVDTLDQLDALLDVAGIDVVLLDNFSLADMREAVRRRDAAGRSGLPALEASGNVNLQTVADIAATGVERISVGALTHSAVALDIGMDIHPTAVQ